MGTGEPREAGRSGKWRKELDKIAESAAGFEKKLEPSHGFFQDRTVRGVADPDVAFAASTEGDAGGEADLRLHQQLLAEEGED